MHFRTAALYTASDAAAARVNAFIDAGGPCHHRLYYVSKSEVPILTSHVSQPLSPSGARATVTGADRLYHRPCHLLYYGTCHCGDLASIAVYAIATIMPNTAYRTDRQ